MDKQSSEYNDQSRKEQINLIEFLNKKSGQSHSCKKDDQDSSLENNISQDSDEVDMNGVQNESDNNNDINLDHPENQNTKIHRNQSHKDATSSFQGRNVNQTANNSIASYKSKKVTKKSKNNQNVRNNILKTTPINLSQRNFLSTNSHNEGEEEEYKDQIQSESTQNQSNRYSTFSSNQNRVDDDEDQYQTIEDEEQEGNYHRDTYQSQRYQGINVNPQIDNLDNNQDNLQGQERSRSSSDPFTQQEQGNNALHPLQTLFPDLIFPRQSRTNNSDLNRNPFSHSSRITQSYLAQLSNQQGGSRNSRLRRDLLQMRNRYRNSSSSDRYNNNCPEGFQIQSTEAAQNQIRYFICAGISLFLIFCFILYTMKNQHNIFYFVIIAAMILSLVYIILKIKRINQSRQNQIHENNYFSYRFTNSANNENNNENYIQDDENDIFGRIPNQQARYTGERRNIGRYLNRMLIFNSLFNILNQLQQQQINAETGYNEEQLNQIGGAHKHQDLKMLLKLQKEQNEDNIQDNQNQSNAAQEEDDDDSCIVCLEKYNIDGDVRILKCQHYFHQICVDEWLKKKKECPVCRQCPLVVDPSPNQVADPSNLNPQGQYPLQIFGEQNPFRRIQPYIGRSRRSNMNLVFVYQ